MVKGKRLKTKWCVYETVSGEPGSTILRCFTSKARAMKFAKKERLTYWGQRQHRITIKKKRGDWTW